MQFTHTGHPVIFSAKGSHGCWTKAHRKTYKKTLNGEKLEDLTSKGTAWDTWNHVKLVHYRKNGGYSGNYAFLNYLGNYA